VKPARPLPVLAPVPPLPALDADREAALRLVDVSRETWERLDRFVVLLRAWQQTTNLVAPSTIPQLWTRHVADSLQLLPLGGDATCWVDLGSGGGFPGIVLACALAERPGAKVHMVESTGKKAAFLRQALQETGGSGEVHCMRIDAFAKTFGRNADVVTARALAPLKDLVGFARPLMKNSAKALFPKGQHLADELTEAAKCWTIEHNVVPSKTDPAGQIVVLRHAQPRRRPKT
jgi:16S rRNA (guanine527-N7)-methyltransferase